MVQGTNTQRYNRFIGFQAFTQLSDLSLSCLFPPPLYTPIHTQGVGPGPEALQGELALNRSLQQQHSNTAWTAAAAAEEEDDEREAGEGEEARQQGVNVLQQQQHMHFEPLSVAEDPTEAWQQQQQQQGINPTALAPQQQYQQQYEQYEQYQQQQYQQYQQQQQQQKPSVRVTARDVSEAVWAAGRLQHYNAAFFRVLRPRFRGLVPGFSDSQLVDMLWGLARLELYDGPNMDAAAEEVRRRGGWFLM